MKLHEFIISDMEAILQAWETFARSVKTSMPGMDAKGLRKHAEYILRTVAADMRTSQTELEQIDKAHGHGPQTDSDAPAKTHALTRLTAGFSMDQMVSEYRALRSSVLRLWLNDKLVIDGGRVQQIIRFNEAIDQALAESIATFGEAVETTRQTVLGVLGHDLRAPLSAITMAGELLRKADYLHERESKLTGQICSSVSRASALVNDLLDLARCNLGTGIPVNREEVRLNEICEATVAELQTVFPDVEIDYHECPVMPGQFDPARMAQAFTNLITNAIQHGSRQHPVRVTLGCEGDQILFSVHNQGEAIPAELIPHLFNLGARYSSYASSEHGPAAGLGLGLFITSQIVAGHDGEIGVESTPQHGTTFRLLLPARVWPQRS